ncbi:MAG: hypothetical protein ACOCVF_01210 [bacterium]
MDLEKIKIEAKKWAKTLTERDWDYQEYAACGYEKGMEAVLKPKWHRTVDKNPKRDELVWCKDINGNLYFSKYVGYYNLWYTKIKGFYFGNMLARQMPLKDIVKWTPVLFPK